MYAGWPHGQTSPGRRVSARRAGTTKARFPDGAVAIAPPLRDTAGPHEGSRASPPWGGARPRRACPNRDLYHAGISRNLLKSNEENINPGWHRGCKATGAMQKATNFIYVLLLLGAFALGLVGTVAAARAVGA